MTTVVSSPCIDVCQIDPASGWCRGCARNIDEIAGWGGKPEAVQRHILAQLPARRADMQRRGEWLGPASPTEERLS